MLGSTRRASYGGSHPAQQPRPGATTFASSWLRYGAISMVDELGRTEGPPGHWIPEQAKVRECI